MREFIEQNNFKILFYSHLSSPQTFFLIRSTLSNYIKALLISFTCRFLDVPSRFYFLYMIFYVLYIKTYTSIYNLVLDRFLQRRGEDRKGVFYHFSNLNEIGLWLY
jgi:hypothetical protein